MTAVEFLAAHVTFFFSHRRVVLEGYAQFLRPPPEASGTLRSHQHNAKPKLCGVKQPELIRCIIPILNSCTLQFPQALLCAAHRLEGQVIEKNEWVDRWGHWQSHQHLKNETQFHIICWRLLNLCGWEIKRRPSWCEITLTSSVACHNRSGVTE